ncbi:MAG: cytochrome-c peroxidase [Chitinophagaceae bacterium]|nr:cytochrome-c peroxidase [Chitinophagaceae bacterium]
MKRLLVAGVAALMVIACSVSVKKSGSERLVIPAGSYEDTLRFLYSLSPHQWPAPFIDSGVQWQELGKIPASPLENVKDSLRLQIALGKALFFDPRLSGSNQISCATCHQPELSWTDGRRRSLGHEQRENRRNSPGLLNVWYYNRLFWDGRSADLEDQSFGPINSESEMHSDMPEVMRKLRRIPGYRALFDSAFAGEGINPETLSQALATFQRTLVSAAADFDRFLEGDKQAMSDEALRGLHIFRTKARCMNCHNGPLLTDNDFHNLGLSRYQLDHEDLGLYYFTHKAEDAGKFKTPSLRDVMRTGPWMHNGMFDNMEVLMSRYISGMPHQVAVGDQVNDSLFPRPDRLIKRLVLTSREKEDLIAFLESITAPPPPIELPELPK